jgi:hypothetical protein
LRTVADSDTQLGTGAELAADVHEAVAALELVAAHSIAVVVEILERAFDENAVEVPQVR